MILEIRLSNFFSIKDEVVLDMRAGSNVMSQHLQANTFAYKDGQVLKSVAIYGANASGKSNIIKAIRFCASLIYLSHTHNESTVFNFYPFKFGNFVQRPSKFFISFVLNTIEFEYSFSLTTTEIIREELYYYPNGRKAKIFIREESAGKTKSEIYNFSSVIRKPMDVAENTSRKTLYISRASQMDREIPKDIFNFFNETFAFQSQINNTQAMETQLLNNKDILLKALHIADSDIVDISLRKSLTTFHKVNDKVPFDFALEESSGTQMLFFMMLKIIDVVKNNRLLLIDEIESSLHCKIVEYIVGLFHASNSAQIIYTTHNTNLLQLNKLRKDQIYFVNKCDDGSSDLYSLFDYKDFRETMDIEKAYLQGRFDAIPYINNSLDNLKTLIR